MPSRKDAKFDLNLLVVFDAVMRERSVTRAAERLSISQPALSHALRRLRLAMDDELFIRTPTGMVPTPRAERLAPSIRQSLDLLHGSLEPTQFNPWTASRTFRIAVDNYAAVLLARPLVARASEIAPQVLLDLRPVDLLNVPDGLDRGELDLALGSFAHEGERFSRKRLRRDEFVAVFRKDHPAAGSKDLSIEEFAVLRHLEVTSVQHSIASIDEALDQQGLTRRIALRAPFLAAERILRTSDLVAVLPRPVADELAREGPLAVRGLFHSASSIDTVMMWPRRLDDQPAHQWLRETVQSVCKEASRTPLA
ncbi:LysR family transcriptional regulator [Devosia sp.]|uniref:LysR family transcriptional regulator n=1 Tax=Devosia sp. TaxID=1871048 RepID=UPI0026248193|nr:LysR family transcriptional regulator [Devosia sp.]